MNVLSYLSMVMLKQNSYQTLLEALSIYTLDILGLFTEISKASVNSLCSFFNVVSERDQCIRQDNILITRSNRACLADFCLASARDSELILSSSTPNARVAGTLRWQAPELLNYEAENSRSSFASDVYSFGCVGYEVGTKFSLFIEISCVQQ